MAGFLEEMGLPTCDGGVVTGSLCSGWGHCWSNHSASVFCKTIYYIDSQDIYDTFSASREWVPPSHISELKQLKCSLTMPLASATSGDRRLPWWGPHLAADRYVPCDLGHAGLLFPQSPFSYQVNLTHLCSCLVLVGIWDQSHLFYLG